MPLEGIYALFKVAIRSGGFDLLLGSRPGFRGFWPGMGMKVAAASARGDDCKNVRKHNSTPLLCPLRVFFGCR